MSKDKLIVKQQLQIEALLEEVENAKAMAQEIIMSLICIGGPLNDNKHGYNKEQMRIFFDIESCAKCIEGFSSDGDCEE